ncbi:3-hydroxyacyl-CoA dehydrogenase NAD-binding domain-containing protein [Acidocella sp. KAb 2-4]|uniref:3-hydroxyacyl-CoA dehydrogenase NAD-binding domain-containing protein n=1 Tax=Acidocella sp. KAb 2-4 TaxID=2885158 RepID=UPI001D067604|nr:3-hydroxyacyl-CoA dehydrogenase NAD-binding domain-containing protein [Acidocella sp. KAb 2-4]MCB5944079.1 enoyl-CoA hydratase/isomerase family protein [Acidocella sp. KAb 2-4]
MEALQLSVREGVLVMEISNPPVNALSQPVRAALMAALARLGADESLRGGVIAGARGTFIAGADIKEFGKPPEAPFLPDVFAAIEACPKPVVAALHGAALGGGLELALACDVRIAEAGTVLGLPEVTLGVIPGAGGTQRLPRLVGVSAALRLIGTAERIGAGAAHRLGVVDEVVEVDVVGAAVAHLPAKRRVSALPVPPEAPEAVAKAEVAALKAGKGRPAVVAAIAAVKDAAALPFAEGLARERAPFLALRASPEAAALRHMFFAEREAMRLPAALRATPRAIETVAVIGAGTMGSGIAQAALEEGFAVILYDQNADLLTKAGERLCAALAERAAAGKITPALATKLRLSLATGWAEIAPADLVIEAVFEDLAVKQEVFRQLDAHAKPGAVLATNTSYLDIDTIAAATSRPQDVLGLHFFSPANVMKLLEVVPGSASAPDLAAAGMEFGKRLKKLPVLCGNAFGFIGNRIYNAYRTQCEFMLEDGAWPEEVDAALEAFGFAMGPFAVADLSGLDIAWRMRAAQAARRDPRTRYVPVLDELCAQGRFGRKSGAGYYTYAAGKRSAGSDATVRGIIAAASAARGVSRHPLAPEDIQRRALAAMVNEAALLLADGVAQRASDIDVVLVQGYGFPRHVGGPVYWARMQDRAALERGIDIIAAAAGFGFRRGSLDLLLTESAP